MITSNKARSIAKSSLSKKRFFHTLCVEKMALTLAKKYGADLEKASIAALLHDIAKEYDRDKALRILQSNGIMAEKIEAMPFCVWHGPVAAIVAKTKYNVDDEEILSAVACHTTGKANMSILDKIIYMADMTSDERVYPEAEILRKAVLQDLDKGLLDALYTSIQWLREEQRPVQEDTLCAYQSLKTQLEA